MTQRKDGFYWIKFNWHIIDTSREIRWEPASWSNGHWVMLGSRQMIPEDAMASIPSMMPAPPGGPMNALHIGTVSVPVILEIGAEIVPPEEPANEPL